MFGNGCGRANLSGTTRTDIPLSVAGYWSASRAVTTFMELCACCRLTPGFSLASTIKERAASVAPERGQILRRLHVQRDIAVQIESELRALKSLGGYSDDRGLLPVDQCLLSHDAGIAAELFLPEVIAQHNERISAAFFALGRKEQTPQRRLHAQARKIIARHVTIYELIRFAGVAESAEIYLGSKHIGKRIGLFAKIAELAVGKREDSQRVALHLAGQHHELFGRLHGQGPQHDAIHEAKDCGVSANAQRQREDHDHGQHGRLREHPEGVTDVLPERGHEGVLLLR